MWPQLAENLIQVKQDGAPSLHHWEILYNTSLMTRYLDVRLGEKEQTLDPWLPDLNLQDFFFWWYVKKCLHSAITKPKVHELKESISETIPTVNADMLHYIRTW